MKRNLQSYTLCVESQLVKKLLQSYYEPLWRYIDMYISTTSHVVQSGRTTAPHSDAATQAGGTDGRRSN